MNWKSIIVEASLLAAIGIVLGTTTNLIRPDSKKLAWRGIGTVLPDQAKLHHPQGTSDQRVTRKSGLTAGDPHLLAPPKDMGTLYLEIDDEVAVRLYSAGALFIDARRSSVYAEGHIEGARNIAVWEHDADTRIQALQGEGLPYDTVIVAYCSGGHCEDSVRLAERLALAGFFNIYVYKEGFPAWKARNLPISRGNLP